VFDGVFNVLEDEPGSSPEAADGRRLGFRRQKPHSPPIRSVPATAPSRPATARSNVRVASSRRFEGGAERFDNAMIERMHFEAAQRVLARAAG